MGGAIDDQVGVETDPGRQGRGGEQNGFARVNDFVIVTVQKHEVTVVGRVEQDGDVLPRRTASALACIEAEKMSRAALFSRMAGRERSRPVVPMAAMMPSMATTTTTSTRVKPFLFVNGVIEYSLDRAF